MIDLHCHLLPGIDDGARNIAESMALAKMAYDSGITHVVCTPHIHEPYFNNDIGVIESTHEIFKSALVRENIPLQSHYAAEVRISPNIVALAQANSLPFLGYLNDRPVLLLELPHSHIPPGTEQLILWLKKNGILPMIAHPERNRDILANYSKVSWLRGKGVLFQLTAGAVKGTFGESVKRCAFKILEDGFADIIATDAHNTHKRPPELDDAYTLVEEEFGRPIANALCKEKPMEIAGCWFNA